MLRRQTVFAVVLLLLLAILCFSQSVIFLLLFLNVLWVLLIVHIEAFLV